MKSENDLFASVKQTMLDTPAYQGMPGFSRVRRMRTLEELVWWLGITNFSSSRLGAEYAALSELCQLHCRFDASHAGLMRLVIFLSNLDTPGYLALEHPGDDASEPTESKEVSVYELTEVINSLVRGRTFMRKSVAQWVLFEDMKRYQTLTFAQLAERVEWEYRREFGDDVFAASTQMIASALEKRPGAEWETVRKNLSQAFDLGMHIGSRLAINWLAQVRLKEPSLQRELDAIKQMTIPQIWRKQMIYTTADPAFLRVLLRGQLLEGNEN